MTQSQTVQTSQTTTEPTQSTQSILGEYADLRWQKVVIEAKLKEIEPLAIDQALDIMSNNEAVNGKQKVYQSDNCEIILQFRTTKPSNSEHPDLETLAELIELEQQTAIRTNAELIAQVEQQIAVLEAHLVGLKNTNASLEYLAEYAELQQKLTTKKPILAVKLL